MKKVLSTLVAALVAVSFSAVVFAAEVKTDVKSEQPLPSQVVK
jgi:Spy/CpxP family protein refolding chaperone